MDRYVVILFWVLIVAVILLSTPTKCMMGGGDGVKEGFYSYNSYFKNYCSDCGFRTRYSCAKCTNCGYSIDAGGVGQCLPGDSSGPFFDTGNTMFYQFDSPYFYYPYSDLYPVIKSRSIYPFDRFKHKEQGPWRWEKKH
jgi:hypothetical protein